MVKKVEAAEQVKKHSELSDILKALKDAEKVIDNFDKESLNIGLANRIHVVVLQQIKNLENLGV